VAGELKITTPAHQVEAATMGGKNKVNDSSTKDTSFSRLLDQGIEKLNSKMLEADRLSSELAAGKDLDIPEVMLSITKADISFRMFVQLRNKALSAYEEIMRLQF